MKRLVQLIDLGTNYGSEHSRQTRSPYIFILRPAAFYWTTGKLFVGYSRMSALHHEEAPLWDPEPVPVGTIIETRAGFYQFTQIQQEGQPYRRKYANLQFAYLYRPNDFGDGFLKKEIDQGSIEIHEKYVLAPGVYLEAQWLASALLHKQRPRDEYLERKILNDWPVHEMRSCPDVDRDREMMEEGYSNPEDREAMIAKYAV